MLKISAPLFLSTLKDMPLLPDGAQKIKVLAHRYK